MTQTLSQSSNQTDNRRDIHQTVTDTIIEHLEKGIVPWHQPWSGQPNKLLQLPQNYITGNNYRGINILLLWCAALQHNYDTAEWGSFKQWSTKKEAIRKGEKGSLIVFYDTFEKEIDGELKKIPFLKSSVVFNRSQLVSSEGITSNSVESSTSIVERVTKIDEFVKSTNATITHQGDRACYIPSRDEILMPRAELFIDTDTCSATEGYYSTLLHELTHWSGSEKRLNRVVGKKFGDEQYAHEELVAELGAAFLCTEFEITTKDKGDHAAYIAHWLKVLKENKTFIFSASSEASKAVDYMHSLQLTT